ncbi:MAG: DUF2520 domain-containing protein [Lentisphaeria bacterium]|nr:DUF2520 domain-containing protein [Lentisphaeria bacterium]
MKESSVIIIGSGNVAAFLARNIASRGIKICRIISRNEARGKSLAAEVNSLWSNDFSRPQDDEGIIISAVKDSAAKEVWGKCRFGNCLVLHTAGTLPLSALVEYAPNCGVLYPLQTISAARELDSRNVPLLIEANSPGNLERLRRFALTLSDKVTEADSAVRGKLHLAAVFANNFANLCFRIAWELAEKEGLDPGLLLPLIEESCAKLRTLSPAEAQTGPAVRWDENVIQKHLELLSAMPETADFYRLASSEIHRRKKHFPF